MARKMSHNSMSNLIGQKVSQRQLFVRVISPQLKRRGKGSVRSMEGFATAITEVVRGFDRAVRDGVKVRYAATVIIEANENILEGKRSSKYPDSLDFHHRFLPPSNRLSKSLRVIEGSGDVIEISHSDPSIAPYGRMHNEPIGSGTILTPKNAPQLKFPNRKKLLGMKKERLKSGKLRVRMRKKPQKYVYRNFVSKPGTAFFDRAVDTANAAIPTMIANEIEVVSSSYANTDYGLTAKGGKFKRSRAVKTAVEMRVKRGKRGK